MSLRFGMILSTAGGALPALLRAARFGLAAPLGSGEQFVPWVALDDALGAILMALHEDIDGPINVVAPREATQRELVETIAALLRRPVGPRLPAPLVRMAAGDAAREMLLASTRAYPRKLIDFDFAFLYPTLERALRWETGRFREDHMTEVVAGDFQPLIDAA